MCCWASIHKQYIYILSAHYLGIMVGMRVCVRECLLWESKNRPESVWWYKYNQFIHDLILNLPYTLHCLTTNSIQYMPPFALRPLFMYWLTFEWSSHGKLFGFTFRTTPHYPNFTLPLSHVVVILPNKNACICVFATCHTHRTHILLYAHFFYHFQHHSLFIPVESISKYFRQQCIVVRWRKRGLLSIYVYSYVYLYIRMWRFVRKLD